MASPLGRLDSTVFFTYFDNYTNSTFNIFPRADAARSKVNKVIGTLSGASKRSNTARLINTLSGLLLMGVGMYDLSVNRELIKGVLA
ncbi:MAG: hypothetical protein AB1607_08325 [Chloroflexota bacterium]